MNEIRTVSEYPSIEEAESALRLDGEMIDRLLTKEGRQRRLVEVLGVASELCHRENLGRKTACLMKLAELRKEALIGQVLRAAAPVIGGALRSKPLWIGSGIVGGGLGLGKLFKGLTAGGMEAKQKIKRRAVETGLPDIYER